MSLDIAVMKNFCRKMQRMDLHLGKVGKLQVFSEGWPIMRNVGLWNGGEGKVWSKPSLSAVATASVWVLRLCSVHWSCCSGTNTVI